MSDTTVSVNGRPVVIPDYTFLYSPEPHVVVRFSRPVSITSAKQLAELGATVEFWCPPYGACVCLSGDAAELLASSEMIAGYVPYDQVA